MANVGYTLMTEQAGPKDLVRWAARAEDTGFDLLVSSDHYFPWLDEQGHAPNAWVTLGAVAQATERAELMTYVTCPTMRYHPAVVAQQAATPARHAPGRAQALWPGRAGRRQTIRQVWVRASKTMSWRRSNSRSQPVIGHHPHRRWKMAALRTMSVRCCTGGSGLGWYWW